MQNYKKVRKKIKLPLSCPINFEFSVENIDCKLCKYFDECLKIFTKAERLSRNIR